MKEISDLNLPDNLRYSDDHEWVEEGKEKVKIGISDYAQDQLGDIVFVELPEIGALFEKGEEFGTVESVKAVSELNIPVSCKIVSINTALEDAPELMNQAPYTAGWVIEVTLTDPSQLEDLYTGKAYLEMLKGTG